MVRDDLHHRPVVVLPESRHRGVLLLLRIAHLPRHRLKAAGRRTEPAAGARIYRNAHHNNVSKGKGTSNRHQSQSFRFKIAGIYLCNVRSALSRKRKSWISSVPPQALRANSTGESRGKKRAGAPGYALKKRRHIIRGDFASPLLKQTSKSGIKARRFALRAVLARREFASTRFSKRATV